MKKIISIIVAIFPVFTFSQEVFKFFEFAPRSTDYFFIGNNRITQKFISFNDHLSIIGLWLENPSFSKIKLSLYNQRDQILFEKIFDIPQVDSEWWGKEYIFPLGENLKIESGSEYKLVIEEKENNNLKIFVKNLLELIQGSENYLYFPETLKPIYYNNEEINYTLKLSLYEGRENLPPFLSNLKINVISPYLTEISFNANEPIKYTLSYKQLSDLNFRDFSLNYFVGCFPSVRNCSFYLETLPGAHYFFRIKAEDFWGNISFLEGEFVSLQESKEGISIHNEGTTTFFSSEKSLFQSELVKPSESLQQELIKPSESQKLLEEKFSHNQRTYLFSPSHMQIIYPSTNTRLLPKKEEKRNESQDKNFILTTSEIIIISQEDFKTSSYQEFISSRNFFKSNKVLPYIFVLIIFFIILFSLIKIIKK